MPRNYTLVKNLIFANETKDTESAKYNRCKLIENKLKECMLKFDNNSVACQFIYKEMILCKKKNQGK